MCGFTLCSAGNDDLIVPPVWRGPFETIVQNVFSKSATTYILTFCRLAVVGNDSEAMQPFKFSLSNNDTTNDTTYDTTNDTTNNTIYAMVNGEIYNHAELRHDLLKSMDLRHFSDSADAHCTALLSDLKTDAVLHGRTQPQQQSDMLKYQTVLSLQLHNTQDKSDCNIIPKLLAVHGAMVTFSSLHAEFACAVIYLGKIILARDRYGVRPLFYGHHFETGKLIALSTMNSLRDAKYYPDIRPFPPGHFLVYDIQTQKETLHKYTPYITRMDLPVFSMNPALPQVVPPAQVNEVSVEYIRSEVCRTFYEACEVRCLQQSINDSKDHTTSTTSTTTKTTAVLLSGGMDSSAVLVAAVTFLGSANVIAITGIYNETKESTLDIKFAKALCEELEVHHHIVRFKTPTLEKMKTCMSHISSWDTTTFRASLAQYLICEEAQFVLKSNNVKVVLCGEGSDELAQGYQYFKNAPDESVASAESQRLLDEIYLYDGLRADRVISAFGLEVRLPFLDTAFVHAYMQLPKSERFHSTVEKNALRNIFLEQMPQRMHLMGNGVIQKILQRPKDAFSDSVGSEWVIFLKKFADNYVLDTFMESRHLVFPHCTPQTKEDYMYRLLFQSVCVGVADTQIPHKWLPKFCGDVIDPSARVLDCYKS